MKKIYLILLAQLFILVNAKAQINSYFFSELADNVQLGTPQIKALKSRTLQVDLANVKKYLKSVPLEFTTAAQNTVHKLVLPMPDGSLQEFDVEESPVMEPGLAAQFPDYKTYTGKGISDPSARAKISLTAKGFHAMIRSAKGTYFVDPYTTLPTNNCIVYDKRDFDANGKTMNCLVGDAPNSKMELEGVFKKEDSPAPEFMFGDCQRRDFRLAMAATGEYTTFHGSTVPLAMAAIVVSVNRINGVYEEEFGVHFNLVANNNLIVYTNAATDPYTNSSGSTMLNENQSNLTTVIGAANYDVGHVFSTGGGGIAQLNSPCNPTGKARGVTGSGAPVGDAFDIDYVAHEMGHQFGGNHTQNNNCNRALAVECGSGVTIMGYAGICSPDVAPHSIDHFHSSNLIEITNFLTSASANCRTLVSIPNNSPTISTSPGNKTIPKSTPFLLTCTASDLDGDILTYNWDQFDNQVSAQPPVPTNTGGPNFRCFSSTTTPDWYFPTISSIANNIADSWQVLPSVARTMNFRLTVRDNHPGNGCTASTTSAITIDGVSGPFVLTSPTTTGLSFVGLSSQTITWDVAGTTAAPVSCANVDILLSTDGGLTYPTVLLSATPNDGSESIILPNFPSTTARIMVRANGNIFFDISNNNFTITTPSVPDYTINANPSTQSVCVNGTAAYTINTSSILGYSTPINLSASGLPGGAVALFSPNPVTPGSSSNLSISGLTSGGTFNIVVNATSTSSNQNAAVTLNVIPNVGTFSLSSPANAATGQSVLPTLTWTASNGATSYDVQLATNAAFTIGLQNITGIASTSHTILASLSASTVYYWRVRAVNSCFTGSYSTAFSFTTANVFCTTFNSTDIPLSISASGAPVVTSNLIIPFSGTILDMNLVNVTGTHSWISDLTFTLRSPGLVNDIVLQNICNDQDNFNVNFDDEASNTYASLPCPPTSALTYQPKNPLSIYDGTALNGTWQLIVNDGFNQDGGSLNTWGLNVCYTPICNLLATVTPVNTSCPSACDGSASVVFSNGIAPYTYAWSNGQTSSIASALCVQSYSLTATDAQGCSVVQNFSVGTDGALPAQPGAFTSSTATVCAGTNSVSYAVPFVTGVTYTWSYSGLGATLIGSGNSISINFSALASSGIVSVTPSNSCGNGPAQQMNISILPLLNWYLDFDTDGYYTGTAVSSCSSPGAGYTSTLPVNGSGDCNDGNASIHPGATDICGNAIDEDCNGSDLSCIAATALAFDGIDDFVEAADNSNLDFGTGNFTVEYWVKKRAASNGFDNMAGVCKWNFGGSSPGQNEWSLAMGTNANDNNPAFNIESGTTTYGVGSSVAMSVGTWHHIAGVRNGTNLHIYLDGVLRGTTVLPANLSINNVGRKLRIATIEANVFQTDAVFDEVRIWNVARSASEIAAARNAELTSLPCELIVYYKFNQNLANGANPGATALTDIAGGDNNASLSNFSLSGSISNWTDGSGITANSSTPLINLTWYLDADADGYYVGAPVNSCTSPGIGYTSILPVNGSGDCNDADNAVHALPAASTISAGGPVNFCAGGNVILSGNNSGGIWNTSETTTSITVIQSGAYFVTNSNSCGDVSSNIINVNANAASLPAYAPTNVSPYLYGFENALPPAVYCGLAISNDNFPADAEQWKTSTLAPRSGVNHMAIDANADGITGKDDWFFSAPLTLSAGVLYRLSFWYRGTNATKTEQLEIYAGNTTNSFDMLLGAPIYTNNSIANLVYVNDSAADFLAPATGSYYFGFYARSGANQASLYIDDIKVRPLSSTNLTTTSCNSTLVSMYDPIYIYPIPGATNYRYKLENLAQSFSSNFVRNSSNPDFRMKWAPGVQYGTTYDVSVSAFANGVWGPFGAACQISIGAFPVIQLLPSSCGATLTDLNTPIYCDTIPGANNYEYRIVNSQQGYDHTWYRNLPINDYRLAWAQSSLVSGLQYGFTYDIQVRALVGKTNLLPGTWGTFGPVCQVTLAGGIPQTQLIPISCGSTLTSFTQAFYCIPVSGATDYQYLVSNSTLAYSQAGTRTNSNTNYQLNWLPSAGGGIRYATTYNVQVRAKVGGVWGTYGSICQLTTPAAPLTALQPAYCSFTLPTFSTQVFCTAVPGATNYRYHITGPGAYDKTFTRNSSANDWRFSWTLLCCGQQNMLANSTYAVEVASYSGGVWSSYGAPCSITTGASIPRYASFDSDVLEESASPIALHIYPNPAQETEQFSIEINGRMEASTIVQLAIYNLLGEKVYGSEISASDESIQSIKPEVKLSAGVYMVEALIDGNRHRIKFVVN